MAKKTTANVNPAVNKRVFVTLDSDAQSLFNHQRRDQAVTFPAIVATVAKAVKDGKIANGTVYDDKYIVVLTASQLAEVFTMARAYQATLPVDVDAAKQAVSYAEAAIGFAKANNSGLDLSEAEDKLAEAKTALKSLVFKKSAGADFRPIVDLANEATTTAKTAVVEHLTQRANALAKETDTQSQLEQVLADLPTDLDQARKALVEFIKQARTLRMPERKKPATNRNGHLTERVGTTLGRTGGFSNRR